ncbi:MAG: PAS domain S-box protein [Nitrospirota bacterium]|nr:MAG: PAS domain S-box protein [Nitrospirota bacterium]
MLFLLFSGLDYVSSPENFKLFLAYRLAIALILIIISRLLGRVSERKIVSHQVIGYMAIALSAAAIELMIMKHGGHVSSYYVFHLLLSVCVIGFIPARPGFHLISALVIYSIYVAPILLFDDITDINAFLTNNIFMIAVFGSVLALRMLNERDLIRSLDMQFEHQTYRNHLEGMVTESSDRLSTAFEELKESEEKYHNLFSQMHNAFAYNRLEMDEEGKPVDYIFLEVNKAFERMTGLKAKDIIDKRASEVFPELRESDIDWIDEFSSVALLDQSFSVERMFEPLDKWLAISSYSPKKGYFVTVFDDISERKMFDDALKKSEQRLASFMDSATDSFVLFDERLRVTDANVNSTELLGKTKNELKNRHVSELFPEMDYKLRIDKMKTALKKSSRYDKYLEVLRTGEPYERDDFLLWAPNGKRYISLKAFKVGNGMGIIATDITERKRMEDQIFRDKQDWEDTFNAITDSITIHDKDFNIVNANSAAEELLDKHIMEKKDNKCFKAFHNNGDNPDCPSCRSIETREPCISETYDEETGKYYEVRALPRLDSNKRIAGLIHVIRDITARKTSQDQIKRQFERLQALRRIDIAITASLDLSHTLNVFLDQVGTLIRADAIDVLLFNKHSFKLEYAAGKGFRSDAVKYSRLRLGEGVAGKVAKGRRSVNILDLQSRISEFTRHMMVSEEGFVTYFGVPLIAKGNLLGIMEIFQRSHFEPDDDWVDFLGALAGQASIAIDNASLFNELRDSLDNLVMAYETTIEGWARALDYRDRETEGHSRRVAELTVNIAREMNISEKDLIHIHRGALLHDIGKFGVPDNILLKADSLTEDEWEIMKKHPEFARDLLFGIPFLRPALDIPYCHHEKWDGSGYPRGMKGEDIPLPARIFAIVDHWDAMTTDRPYRPAVPEKKVVEEIKKLAGKFFDPAIVKVFLKMDVKVHP